MGDTELSLENTKKLIEYKNRLKPWHKIDFFLLMHPGVSTTLVGAFLASIWLIAWLLVLFFATVATYSGTTTYVFIAGLLLSTCAEAIIRRAETSKIFDRWSRGTLKPDPSEITTALAAAVLFGGLLLAILIPDLVELPKNNKIRTNIQLLEIYLEQGESFAEYPKAATTELTRLKGQSIPSMFMDWVSLFLSQPIMLISVFLCWVLRIMIYKRPAKTEQWKLAKLHINRIVANLNKV